MNQDITILIIDDDTLMQKVIEASLLKDNYKLLFASDGESGLQAAREHMPDLILLDIVMPGMDGFEVCNRMRKDDLMLYIPIIILTALDDRDSKIQGLEAGADDYICKPFDKLEFRARVRTITRLNRYTRWRKIHQLQEEAVEKNKIIDSQKQEIEKLKMQLQKIEHH
jgi:Response regulators consisting of a CheY-like receiver domain and a winged-helix DNA-binding domain